MLQDRRKALGSIYRASGPPAERSDRPPTRGAMAARLSRRKTMEGAAEADRQTRFEHRIGPMKIREVDHFFEQLDRRVDQPIRII